MPAEKPGSFRQMIRPFVLAAEVKINMGNNPSTVTLSIHDVRDQLPSYGEHVLAFYSDTVDRAALYGKVWRHAEYGEDQIYGVTHWADLPDVEHASSTT
jgi:hypothetical protein